MFCNTTITSLGRVDIDFEKEPLAINGDKPVFLSDIWPSRKEVQAVELNLGMVFLNFKISCMIYLEKLSKIL